MGIAEWTALITLVLVILGILIKVTTDKTEVMLKIDQLEKWKETMDKIDYVSGKSFDEGKENFYRDIKRLEEQIAGLMSKFDEHTKRVNTIDNNVIKILTIIDRGK